MIQARRDYLASLLAGCVNPAFVVPNDRIKAASRAWIQEGRVSPTLQNPIERYAALIAVWVGS